ncbi:serine hydrolase domain-containing protein [Tsuneonella sp. HG222]
MPRRRLPSLALAMLPALLLAACGGGTEVLPPVDPEALEAVSESPGVPREKLARAVDGLFSAEAIGETRALVVYHAGEIAAERYGEGYGPRTPFIGWSMSKTVTGIMIGALVAEGRLHLDRSPPIPAWRRPGDPRGEITLRQLMQMRSGLRHQEQADPVYESGEVRMMFLDGRDDMAGWAEEQPLDHEPGRHFQYSTPSTMILSDIAARVLAPDGTPDERRLAVTEFMTSRLNGPLRAQSFLGEFDRSGTMLGGSMIWATARDWGRLGEMMRHKGSVRGTQIVPRGWIEFMTAPSPRAPDYGALTWLNRDSGEERHVLFPEQGPKDAFAAVGHLGQYVIVIPSRRLTIVRLGKTDNEMRPALVDEIARIAALYPEE